MKTKFDIELLKFKNIKVLPDAWSFQQYRDLLEVMDYEDSSTMPDAELEEMCLLALSELNPEDAATIVLAYVFKDRLSEGQIANLSHEMQEEKLWEEYADLALHEEFFNVHQLLYKAYNGKFPRPEAVDFIVKITARDKEDLQIFEDNTAATLVRLLVNGMPENTLIKRLFKEQLKGNEFTAARHIIWQLHQENQGGSLCFEIISSGYWFKDFEYVNTFEAEVKIDHVVD